MQHSPGYYKRLMLLALHRDLARVAIALLVLFALLLAHAPLVLVLAAPLLVYLGLWLLIPAAPARSSLEARDPLRKLNKSTALQDVQAARDGIADAARQAPDPESAETAERITEWIDRSLGVIAEDKKPETLTPLLELATFTNDLLARYIKLCRRGLANTATHEQMKQNLAVIEDRFKWFWEQLNRDAIVDLAALSAAIDLFMQTVPAGADPGLSTVDALSSPANGAPATSNSRELSLIATLTAREVEVLRHIAGGRTNRQIADSMFIATSTVAKHIETILDKLGVQNRTEAAALAIRNGIVPPSDLSDDAEGSIKIA